MKNKILSQTLSLIFFLIGAIAIIFFMASESGDEKTLYEMGKLPLIQLVQDNPTSTTPSISIWGPIEFTQANRTSSISVETNSLNNSWAEGFVALVEAHHFEDSSGSLLNPEEIKSVLNNKNTDGKSNIIENYGFDFSFSRYSGYDGGESWVEEDKDIKKYFKLEKAGRYYILLRFYSERKFTKHYNPRYFRFEVVENTMDYVLSGLGLFIFFIFIIYYFFKLIITIVSRLSKK